MPVLLCSASWVREGNGPVERADDLVYFDATGDITNRELVKEHHGEASLGSRESTRPTSNDVNFRDFERPAVSIRQFRLPENCRIDAVSIGGDPLSRPCGSEVREVSRNFPYQ